MEKMAQYALLAGTLSTALALIAYLFYAFSGVRAARLAAAGVSMSTGRIGLVSGPRTASIGVYASLLGWLAFAFLGASLIFRTIATGHGPFSNMYEFSVAFCWGIIASTLYFQWRYRMKVVTAIGVVIALALLAYAYTLPSRHVPLQPALQQSLLLSFHVAAAMVAYGTFAIGFGAAAVYLLRRQYLGTPAGSLEPLEDVAHRAVLIGFPFMTLTIVLGALWADIAWGRYWGWDPKETSSLVTWLVYAAYLHARVLRGWRGSKSVSLIVLGFLAVLFTYFGNYFFGGLHGYR